MSQYELQLSSSRNAVWIHSSEDGSTVGRFGRMGVDLHNTATEQMLGMPECRLCTHGRPSESDWALFRSKALEWWGVTVPEEAFDRRFFASARPD
ncbi:hypothetical protein D3M70_12375 [Pseudomonas sp. LS-2]|nr:hypothetical protein D3M70_12375 [Pseudomonas sp. LS-2]